MSEFFLQEKLFPKQTHTYCTYKMSEQVYTLSSTTSTLQAVDSQQYEIKLLYKNIPFDLSV